VIDSRLEEETMKKNSLATVLVLCQALMLVGCSSNPPNPTSRPHNRNVTLHDIEGLRIGSITKENITKIFGPPTREIDLANYGGGVGWVYKVKGGPEFSLTFDPTKNVLIASLWSPLADQPEATLQGVLARYPHAHFTLTKRQWTAADAIYERSTYSDKKLGISFALRNYSDTSVESIAFDSPNINGSQRLPSQK
jgi:hypothetical protein